ncbi:hypothetical protein PR048_024962 [Dryococelus australis]|uniref:Uncharacterized protein n=1 Tax=Dryococelus australis TaxID=614101 RepID=A0ABQ9GQ27_9NEOP|nr:hypothetical protein PR048_024962 [Dryococelus australis]
MICDSRMPKSKHRHHPYQPSGSSSSDQLVPSPTGPGNNSSPPTDTPPEASAGTPSGVGQTGEGPQDSYGYSMYPTIPSNNFLTSQFTVHACKKPFLRLPEAYDIMAPYDKQDIFTYEELAAGHTQHAPIHTPSNQRKGYLIDFNRTDTWTTCIPGCTGSTIMPNEGAIHQPKHRLPLPIPS